MIYFINELYNCDFARTKGAKDEKPRKKKNIINELGKAAAIGNTLRTGSLIGGTKVFDSIAKHIYERKTKQLEDYINEKGLQKRIETVPLENNSKGYLETIKNNEGVDPGKYLREILGIAKATPYEKTGMGKRLKLIRQDIGINYLKNMGKLAGIYLAAKGVEKGIKYYKNKNKK